MAGGYDVLLERGFIKQCTDEEGLKKKLNTESVSLYVGIDPTGSSLHVGHLVPFFAMSHLQAAGHKPIAVIGGGTARIGDPSGKTETRQMLTVEKIKENVACFKKQLSSFIDFTDDKASMVDNADWLANLNYIDFLRDIGRHFSVNRMLSFETYKMRMETGLSFIEFNYQLLQSYDFLVLNQKYGCTLQLGGDDQWGNIVAGMDLIRRIEGKEAYGLTVPLITRADGKKMGKTEKGALFLDPQLVTPYEFYQYWVNVPDQDVEKFLLLFTYLPVEECKRLGALQDSQINEAKRVLAYEITKIVHGQEEADKAKEAAKALFSSGGAGNVSDIPSTEFELPPEGIAVIDLFSQSGLVGSKSDARRLITQGGAKINEQPFKDINEKITSEHLKEGALILRAGKKRYWKMIPQ